MNQETPNTGVAARQNDKLPVFISWSGRRAQLIADALKKTLAAAVQSTRPFFSSDIEPGTQWSEAIRKALTEAEYGIVVLTPDNVESNWVHFEAGAISKLPGSRVSTLLVGVRATNVRPPLGLFQATDASSSQALATLFRKISDYAESTGRFALEPSALDAALGALLPSLHETISESAGVAPRTEANSAPERSEPEKLDELLATVRRLERNTRNPITLSREEEKSRMVNLIFEARTAVRLALAKDHRTAELVARASSLDAFEVKAHLAALEVLDKVGFDQKQKVRFEEIESALSTRAQYFS